MAVPENIRKIPRPKNTIVQGHTNKDGVTRYVVRSRAGVVYSNGRSMPKNGPVIGYIIDGKYVAVGDVPPVEPREVQMRTWAVERFALDNTSDVIDDLRAAYGERDGEIAYAMALLRVRHPDLSNSRMKRDYDESLLSEVYPNLGMSKNSVSEHLQDLGSSVVSIRRFIERRLERIGKGSVQVVDGTLIHDESCVNNLSNVSRKTRGRGGKDISMIFAFDIEKMEPTCYAVYPGNMVDSKVYSDFIEFNDLRDVMLMGDKAFTRNAAKKQFTGERHLHHFFPLRRNSKIVEKFRLHSYNTPLRTYRGVSYCIGHDTDEGLWYYSFRDTERAAEEESDFLDSCRRSGKGFSDEELRGMKENWGTMIFQSDCEMSAEDAYDLYRKRWMIEEMFRLYKHIEDFDDTRVQSDISVNGEYLVNFVSTIVTSRLMRLFLESGLLDSMTFGEIMDVLRRSMKFKDCDGEWTFRAQTDKEKDVLRTLDLMPKVPPKRRGRPPKNH